MRLVRHAALLLLILLLAGGPALRAAAQVGCAAAQAHCPMCEHRAEPMECMGGQAAHAHAVGTMVSVDAVVAGNSDCFCGQLPVSQVEQAQAAPLAQVDEAPLVAVATEPAWPSMRELVGNSVSTHAAVEQPAVRTCAFAPLRV